MNVLEKILEKQELEAIKDLMEENEKCLNQCEGACGSAKNGVCNCSDGILVQAIRKMQDYLSVVTDTNVGKWIPVNERLPEVPEGTEDAYCPEFNVTIKGADKATTLKYSPDGTWFDDDGVVYKVTAWKPLPEPYRSQPEQQPEPNWRQRMMDHFQKIE